MAVTVYLRYCRWTLLIALLRNYLAIARVCIIYNINTTGSCRKYLAFGQVALHTHVED